MPKDEKKTFRQSGLMIIHESRDPRVYNVKRGCTYSQGIPINSILFSFPFNGSWTTFHDFFFNILKLKLKFSA